MCRYEGRSLTNGTARSLTNAFQLPLQMMVSCTQSGLACTRRRGVCLVGSPRPGGQSIPPAPLGDAPGGVRGRGREELSEGTVCVDLHCRGRAVDTWIVGNTLTGCHSGKSQNQRLFKTGKQHRSHLKMSSAFRGLVRLRDTNVLRNNFHLPST